MYTRLRTLYTLPYTPYTPWYTCRTVPYTPYTPWYTCRTPCTPQTVHRPGTPPTPYTTRSRHRTPPAAAPPYTVRCHGHSVQFGQFSTLWPKGLIMAPVTDQTDAAVHCLVSGHCCDIPYSLVCSCCFASLLPLYPDVVHRSYTVWCLGTL